ncbi:protein phosphatase 2C domain-containing protein [Actinomadura rubrisoli]|uniref:Integrase n=1 Tax=Actinomadura rubrisoli TaxID=2530368 RepID=A0A4R5AW32_9ACTN|nr:protein phosphatase 2C domain-containing protein [Actinomadura rubrisoli]TDD74832.1 integrase [Actinomadura rubrisoli]
MNVSFATAGKAPKAVNEDYVAAAPDMVVLLDGSGLPPESDIGCKHGLPWFVRFLAARFMDEARNTDESLTHALRRAIAATSAAHADTCDPMHPQSPSATVVAVRTTASRQVDWLVLGDSFVVLRDGEGFKAFTDQRLKQSAVQQRNSLRQANTGDHGLWAALVAEERRLRNHPDGYWVAAGEPAAAEHALTGTTPVHDLTHALLLSDGGARPVEPFGVTTWEECFDRLIHRGMRSWLDHVRDVENTDPDRTRWARSKRHDDATIALIEF